MSLIKQGMVEKGTGANDGSLTMQAGESALIRDLYYLAGHVNHEDVDIDIDRKRIMQFKAPVSWFLLHWYASHAFIPMVEAIKAAGLWPSIPLGEGQTFTAGSALNDAYMEIVYDLYEAGDIKSTDDNGSDARRYRLFQTISNSDTITAAGDWPLDQSSLDAVFPQFPGGAVVPAGTEMHLLGLYGAPVSKGGGAANGQYTTHLKFIANREDMFDKDLTGMNFLGNAAFVLADVEYQNVCGRLANSIEYLQPRIIAYDEPIIFKAGEELNVYATIAETGATGDLTAGQVALGLIFDVVTQ